MSEHVPNVSKSFQIAKSRFDVQIRLSPGKHVSLPPRGGGGGLDLEEILDLGIFLDLDVFLDLGKFESQIGILRFWTFQCIWHILSHFAKKI